MVSAGALSLDSLIIIVNSLDPTLEKTVTFS